MVFWRSPSKSKPKPKPSMSGNIPDIDKHDKDQSWGWIDVDSDTGDVVILDAPIQTAQSFIDATETLKYLPSQIELEDKKAARRRASNPMFQRVKLSPKSQAKADGKTPVVDKDEESSSGETCSLSSIDETYSYSTDDGFYFDKAKLLPLIETESSSEGEEASAPISEVEVEVIMPTVKYLGGVGTIKVIEEIERTMEAEIAVNAEKKDVEDSTIDSKNEDENVEKVSLVEFLRRDELTLAAVCTVFLFGSMWALEQGRGPANVFMRPL